jgi:hypothetical protein
VKLDTIVEASFKLMIYDQSNGKHKEQLGKVANYIFLVTLSDIAPVVLPVCFFFLALIGSSLGIHGVPLACGDSQRKSL